MPPPTAVDLQDSYGFRIDAVSPLGGSDRAWRVDSEHGPHVLRLHTGDRFAAHAGEVAALQFLEARGVPAPRLVNLADGMPLFRWGPLEGYLTTFVPGSPLSRTAQTAWQLGATTGRLHALDAEGAGLPATSFTVATERGIYQRLDADPVVRAWEGYPQIRDHIARAWEALPDLHDVPRALVHTDILFENAVMSPDGQAVLIDWDDAGLGPAIQDIGYLLVHEDISVHGDLVQSDLLNAILDGYESERPLSVGERWLLPEAMLFGALSYVLAPWEPGVLMDNWRRVRFVINHRDQVRSLLDHR